MTEPKKKKGQKKSHPWRVWVPKSERGVEQSRFEKIPVRYRMGVKL